MGAHELAPLSLAGEPAIGTVVELEVWGPPFGASLLYWTWGPTHSPIQTRYGEWLLGQPHQPFAATLTAPWPPVSVSYPTPADPVFIGRSISFQGLTRTGWSSPPWAYTNPQTLTFVE